VKVRPGGAGGVKNAEDWASAFNARVSWGSSRSPWSRSTPIAADRTTFTSVPALRS
jgi:hypothetical protein